MKWFKRLFCKHVTTEFETEDNEPEGSYSGLGQIDLPHVTGWSIEITDKEKITWLTIFGPDGNASFECSPQSYRADVLRMFAKAIKDAPNAEAHPPAPATKLEKTK